MQVPLAREPECGALISTSRTALLSSPAEHQRTCVSCVTEWVGEQVPLARELECGAFILFFKGNCCAQGVICMYSVCSLYLFITLKPRVQ